MAKEKYFASYIKLQLGITTSLEARNSKLALELQDLCVIYNVNCIAKKIF